MMSHELISVGIPVFNGEKELATAIRSVLEQTHKNLELLISDNASTDRSLEIIKEFAEADSRVKYFCNDENLGVKGNLDTIRDMINPESNFLTFLSHDDYYCPTLLERALSPMMEDPEIILSSSYWGVFRETCDNLRFIDVGAHTVGMDVSQRFITYRKSLHTGRCVASMIGGIQRLDSMRGLREPKILGADHVVLAHMVFNGSFNIIPEVLSYKKSGGISDYPIRKQARLSGIESLMSINAPYLVREYYFQREIWGNLEASLCEKIKMCIVSIYEYIKINLIRDPILVSLHRTKYFLLGPIAK